MASTSVSPPSDRKIEVTTVGGDEVTAAGPLGCGFERDLVAEGLELVDVIAFLAVGVDVG
jgi:hypothetical protein